MSTNEQTPLSQSTSAVINTLGKEQAPQNLVRPVSDEDLREYCDKNYHQILPIIPEKLHQEKAQQEKLKAVKARLNFEEASRYFESETPSRRRNLTERLRPRYARTRSGSPEPRRGRSKSPRKKDPERRTVFKRLEKETEIASEKHRHKREYSRRTEVVSESEGSAEGHWKSKPKKQKSSIEDDLSQPWVCDKTDRFTPHIRYFDFPKARMPSHIKTYDGSEDPEDHLKFFQAAAKTERWAMPTWCHMFNSTLTENARVWFDDLSKEFIDSYDDFRKTFLENCLQQKKCIKDPVEIHNNKLRDGESTEEFVRRYKLECGDVKGASECMKISGFMHGITNPKLIKRLHDKISKSMDEMMSVTTAFLRWEVAASNRERKKSISRQRITQTFFPESIIYFPTLGEEDGTEGPIIIEAEIGGYCVHRIYVDGGSSSEILYEHCFSKFCLEIKNQLITANTPLVRFSGEIIWPLGQRSLLVKIGDKEHLTFAWMNFMVVRSPSPYNGIRGRPGVRKIRAIPSTAHGMIKFPVAGGIVTLCRVAIRPKYPEQTIAIGFTLTAEGQKELCGLLRRHLDVWLSNPVMVKKHDDSWRMCVDFKDLNKACPKDGYLLPEIDWNVESLGGYPNKCFLDAYKGYHQIKMAKEDEEKTTFITSQGILCYSKMSSGLKNAGATYQRLVDKAFQKLIGRNLEVYLDDLVIKIRTKKEVIRDIEETFKTLKEINMKLNPKKCAFGMREGTFLGYKVDAGGLRVCPDKVEEVLDLPSLKCLKDVQKLNGKLASLNRFLSKPTEKSLPFFKTLKKCTKKSDFQWTAEAEGAFKEMKKYIAELPMLTAPREKEELIMYLEAAKKPSAHKRLKRYFQAHTIVVITDQPIKQLLSNPEVTGRLLKWRFELGEHDIQYRPRTSVKGKILANFIVEHPKDDTPDTSMEDRVEISDPWILFTDGSSCIDGFGAGLIITNPEGMEFTYALRFRFNATNNEAEYEALIAGLRIAGQMGVQNLQANVDSKLVANQVNGIYISKESSMIKYLEKVKNLASTFKGFFRKQIPRGENKKVDSLSKITSTSFAHLSKQVLVEELREKATYEKEILAVVEEEGHTWMTLVYEYLTEGILPKDKKKARVVCPGKVKILIVAMDYFIKWIEARPVETITGAQVKKFVWDNIVCRFGLLGEIVSDNSKQFRDNPFKDWCEKLIIKVKIDMPTLRTTEVDMVKNNEALGISLDLLEEKREQAAIQEARNKAKMKRYYNARVRSTSFRPGDFIYRSNEASHADDGVKLGPKWEGPYEVTKALGKGAYILRDRNGHTLPRTWNICNLKKCYMHEM
nr:reverse transcriptase domain-containing protein [Tanacetum cinerariifolium]